VTESDVIVEAFTELAPDYEDAVDSELRRFWGWSYEGFVQRLLESVAVGAGDTILDVATGTAVIPRKITSQINSNSRVVGLDITLSMLRHGQRFIRTEGASSCIILTCASAMAMPFPEESFDVVICGLATHHMDVPQMLSEMRRVLKWGGYLTLADVAASQYWRLPGIKASLKLATFFYFLLTEGIARARAESDAVSHVHTADEWRTLISDCGFVQTELAELPGRRFWCPAPLILRATKA
jgi:ubiquinone/menaquinone biosynthesis C-methylase UbiE